MRFHSFPVTLDNCTILTGSSMIEQSYPFYWKFPDRQAYDKESYQMLPLIRLLVTQVISGKEWQFISPAYADSPDAMRCRIELLQNVRVHYCPDDLAIYSFEVAA